MYQTDCGPHLVLVVAVLVVAVVVVVLVVAVVVAVVVVGLLPKGPSHLFWAVEPVECLHLQNITYKTN